MVFKLKIWACGSGLRNALSSVTILKGYYLGDRNKLCNMLPVVMIYDLNVELP